MLSFISIIFWGFISLIGVCIVFMGVSGFTDGMMRRNYKKQYRYYERNMK